MSKQVSNIGKKFVVICNDGQHYFEKGDVVIRNGLYENGNYEYFRESDNLTQILLEYHVEMLEEGFENE